MAACRVRRAILSRAAHRRCTAADEHADVRADQCVGPDNDDAVYCNRHADQRPNVCANRSSNICSYY